MTWRTSMGDRCLEGAEAAFYIKAVQCASDYLQSFAHSAEGLEVETYDRLFDLARFDQKMVLLHTCLCALLDSTIPAPELNNLLEAAAYFPFAVLLYEIAIEIDLDQAGELEDADRSFYRQIVWQPFEEYVRPQWQAEAEEYGADEAEQAFNLHSHNLELWEDAIEELLDRIFWDRDWMITSEEPQVLDGIEEAVAKRFGLTDYFTNRLPIVTAEQAQAAFSEIRNWQSPL